MKAEEWVEKVLPARVAVVEDGDGMEELRADLLSTFRVLVAEIERLKRGDFTEEEFQNLCHNLPPERRASFEAGCRAFTDKLFGPKATDSSVNE